jgi:hypothetical protein
VPKINSVDIMNIVELAINLPSFNISLTSISKPIMKSMNSMPRLERTSKVLELKELENRFSSFRITPKNSAEKIQGIFNFSSNAPTDSAKRYINAKRM